MIKQITSRNNDLIKEVSDLQNAQARNASGLFIAQGIRVCESLHKSGVELVQLFFTEDQMSHIHSFPPDIEYIQVNDSVMRKISSTITPSGILGVFRMPMQPAWNKLTSGLVLAQVADPGNMGTMIRTCAALAIKSVVIIEGADPFSPKVVQASAGTLGVVKIFRSSWDQLQAQKNKLEIAALVLSGGQSPKQIDPDNTLLMVGSEAHGIPENWVAQSDQRVTIPMPGAAESLNAAVAASIALYAGWKLL